MAIGTTNNFKEEAAEKYQITYNRQLGLLPSTRCNASARSGLLFFRQAIQTY